MDIVSVGGVAFAWICVATSVILEGGHLGAFFKLPPAILVIGGSIGASIISSHISDLKHLPEFVKKVFLGTKYDYRGTITQLIDLAVFSRQEGLLSLESRVEELHDDFAKKGFQMVIDGVDQESVREIMETDIATLKHHYKEGEEFFCKMGGFSPTLGVIGTVLGLVHMLQKLDDPGAMGPAIAAAFVATLYGVALANLLYLPVAGKIKRLTAMEILQKRILLEGMLAIQSGASPRVLEQKLTSFLSDHGPAAGGKGGKGH